MQFKQWLETRVLDVHANIVQSITQLLPGEWQAERSQDLTTFWNQQKYHSVKLTGRDVIQRGDICVAYVKIGVYTFPQGKYDPSWDDQSKWHKLNNYDPKTEHPLIELGVTVYGGPKISKLAESEKLKTPSEIAAFIFNAMKRFA